MNPPTTTSPVVPFIDLRAQYESIRTEIDEAIQSVLRSGQFVLGPSVSRFEREFASYLGVRECVCVNSGTAALHIGLTALGLRPGDEVILPALTFFATAEAVVWAGGRPVFVDVREDDGTMDPDALEAAFTPRTRAVIPVDLWGQPARYDQLTALADRRGAWILEDACQAHGAAMGGRRAGTFGRGAAFSFYPGKNLGAFGEGGAFVTNDARAAATARALRDHGQTEKYRHALMGHNFRLEALQGAILGAKLPHLDAWNEGRRRVAEWYDETLRALPLIRPVRRPEARHAHHLYVVRTPGRDALRAHMEKAGIETLVHYPLPLHLQPALEHLGLGRGSFPVSERLADSVVSLPIYAEMTQAMVGFVAREAASFFAAPARTHEGRA